MNASNPENVCPICKKVFSRKADCNRHLRLHAGIRPYPCEVAGCGKRFAQYTALKTHRNVHTGLKPFKCEFAGCKATFGDPSSCARHRREIHSPKKPFKCPVPGCSSSIRRLSSFKTHLKKHGLDPSTSTGSSQRDHSLTTDEEIQEGHVSMLNGNPEIQLSDLPESWNSNLDSNQFLLDPFPLLMQPDLSSVVSSGSPLLLAPSPRIASDNGQFFLSTPRSSPASSSRYSSPLASTPIMQPELTSVFSSSSPLHLTPSPRMAPDNEQFFFPTPRTSPVSSSKYSSPTATPVLTPEIGSGYLSDISAELVSSCLATAEDWTRNAWQAHGIQFV
ncbi:hypothetical protein DFH94DRAFT_714963 [Russula ochroleuca]|uniref:C2H2-type domain-containing protein n=1 Tax=Russula ochroleuca TaxID=152965 RepID=A0A9P5TC40_9AGAM|nr:hypothetical protein DFH94DRAFT_714963 [Russula ochroleuca]